MIEAHVNNNNNSGTMSANLSCRQWDSKLTNVIPTDRSSKEDGGG